jgi:uncharacterized protein affecting Mg2+/Co2+ transport
VVPDLSLISEQLAGLEDCFRIAIPVFRLAVPTLIH